MDERPPVWIGHAHLRVSNGQRAAQWWCDLGMREIAREPEVAVLELRGRIHSGFEATDPDGYRVTVNSTHVVGPV